MAKLPSWWIRSPRTSWLLKDINPRTPSFLIYINEISDNVQSSMSLFADDATLYFSSKFPSHLHLVLWEDLVALGKCFDTWSFSFDAQKTKVLTIFSNRDKHLPLIFKNMQLQEVNSHKHVGLLFHNSLSWQCHILSLHQRAILHIYRLKSRPVARI